MADIIENTEHKMVTECKEIPTMSRVNAALTTGIIGTALSGLGILGMGAFGMNGRNRNNWGYSNWNDGYGNYDNDRTSIHHNDIHYNDTRYLAPVRFGFDNGFGFNNAYGFGFNNYGVNGSNFVSGSDMSSEARAMTSEDLYIERKESDILPPLK